MARIRTVKPEFFHDKSLANCTPHARLLAIALLQLADCEGRMRNIPMQIHAHAFPWESSVNTQALLSELANIDYVILYEFEGNDYIQIPKFLVHQRLQGKEAQMDSKLPAYDPETQLNKRGNEKGSKGEYPNASQGMTGTGEQGNRGTGEKEEEQGNRGTGEKEEEQGKREEDKTIVPLKRDDALDVFEYWQEKMDHPKSAYDDKRKALIRKWLKHYPVGELKKAIYGCSVTPHNMGDNDRGQRYDSLRIILKDGDQIDRFISNADNPPAGNIRTIQQTQDDAAAQAERIKQHMELI